MRRRVILTCLTVALAACHTQTRPGGQQRLPNLISEEEIDASTATNLYDLIAQLRAEFLKDRGRVSIRTNTRERAVVFLNDQEYGILETLRNIPPGRVSEIRYYSGIDAVSRFGAQYGGGVVMLISRTQ